MNSGCLCEMLGSDLVVAAACPAVLFEETSTREEDAVSPRSRKLIPWPQELIPILLASSDPEDHAVLPEILDASAWRWNHSRNCRQAEKRLQSGRIGVVLCERDLPDGSWRDLFEACRYLKKPASFIVCSRLADEQLWSEVLNLGGYDVLIKPFVPEEVVRVVHAAWRSWQRASAAAPPRVRTSGTAAF